MQDTSVQSYRDLLKEAYSLRKQKNRAYSLRSFAKHLEVSPAYLTLLFQEKRHLNQRTAGRMAEKLNWSAKQKKFFVSLVQFENPHSEESRELAIEQISKLRGQNFQISTLETDRFAMMTNWQDSAILSLLTLPKFRSTTAQICRRLNLDRIEAEASLHRLQRLGLVKPLKNLWLATNNFTQIQSTPSEAIRIYHRQMMALATKAVDGQVFEERDFSNITLTVDRSRLPAAKKRIQEFQLEMAAMLEGTAATDVYQFSTQLFRLSEKENANEVSK
jgi:uncharacterized protein (TIGR02147 family)